MRKLGYIMLLAYVFIIPIYYFHFKEDYIERGNPWDNKASQTTMAMAVLWPLAGAVEVYRDWNDFLAWKEKVHQERKKHAP